MPLLTRMLKARYIQKITRIVYNSHSPVYGIPYCSILITMVPAETMDAGIKRASFWLRKDSLNEPGTHMNRKVNKQQFMTKRHILNIMKITPIICSQSDRKGTEL